MPSTPRPTPTSNIGAVLAEFLRHEAAGGIVLMVAAAAALVVANSALAPAYFAILHMPAFGLSISHWINDGLMAIFFLLVGLEIKREMVDGELSSWPRRILPGMAAVGGMIAPALIYVAFNATSPETIKGWAIPAATDIAFALGVISLLGSRVPVSLKIFLAALAILDDLGAIVIIALFYTAHLDLLALGGVVVVIAALVLMNRRQVMSPWPYLVLGAVLWVLFLRSGLHATLAGVVLALTIPLRVPEGRDVSAPLLTVEHALQRWVAFAIVPLFGFANAGVSFTGMSLETVTDPVPLGVALGLFVGKQLGVFLFAWLALRFRWAVIPQNATMSQLYGVALLCGIGFTMSLFIGLLAFPSAPLLMDEVRIGVLLGSLLSALAGMAVLYWGGKKAA